MAATLIDGKTIAARIRAEITLEVNALLSQGIRPCLAVILIGDNAASRTYVNAKHKASRQVGIRAIEHRLVSNVTEAALLDLINRLNLHPGVHGILVQLPLPAHIDKNKIIEAIAPAKDVDGFHPFNVGCLVTGVDGLRPCTPCGVMELIDRSGVHVCGKHVVIVGRSNIVGKPLMNLLLQKDARANATVTVCHSRTHNIKRYTRQADVLVAAIGRARFITADLVKPAAVVIDVGINSITENGRRRVVGDVDLDTVRNVASQITPVPGGVGPMTVAMLMQNVVTAATLLTAH